MNANLNNISVNINNATVNAIVNAIVAHVEAIKTNVAYDETRRFYDEEVDNVYNPEGIFITIDGDITCKFFDGYVNYYDCVPDDCEYETHINDIAIYDNEDGIEIELPDDTRETIMRELAILV